jgi:hypothetical protein
LPEIYFEWFNLICEEISHFIKELNSFLSLFDTLVENVANLILRGLEAKLIDFVVLEFDGDNGTCLFEHLLNFLLGSSQRNELNVQVGFEHILLVLLNLAAFLQLTFLLVNVRRDKDSLSFDLSLHVCLFKSFSG